jgi:hypothetical protein
MEQLFARHGDLVINRAPIPTNIELSEPKAPVVLAGRESAPHAIAEYQHVKYGQSEGIQYLRVAKEVELSHSERHKTIALPPGDYQVASLAEMNGDLARAVED